MSKALLFETETVLNELKNLRKTIEEKRRKFARYGGITMVNSVHKKRRNQQYYIKQKEKPRKKYLGTEGSVAVMKIKGARYYNKMMEVIDTDIKLLENIENEYVIPNHANINELLPKTYRVELPPLDLHVSKVTAEWKKRMEEEKSKYEPYMAEDLVHEALDGTMMRSHSEVLIANYLISLGITFVYEMPLTANGKRIWPDFTILSPVDYKTVIIIEHQGAMESEQYQGKFIRTIMFYLGTKLVPNKDVFFTFNHLDGNLDLRQIDYILHTAFGLVPK